MGSINLTNSKGRDAMVATRRSGNTLRVRWLDGKGRQAENVRICRAPLDHEIDAIKKSLSAGDDAESLNRVTDALIAGDPEIDLERTGGYLRDTSRVYVDPEQKIITAAASWEIVRNPDGSVRERRPEKSAEPNVATETPLRFSGKLLKKSEVWNRFVFSTKLQVVHINGLTYDFLYELSRELEVKESLLLIGAGPKSSAPLVFQRGGTAYRGFLEGRTRGESYCLILHLSNLELKAPAKAEKGTP